MQNLYVFGEKIGKIGGIHSTAILRYDHLNKKQISQVQDWINEKRMLCEVEKFMVKKIYYDIFR